MFEIGNNLQDHFLFSSLLFCKNIVHDSENTQNTCSAVHVIGKASAQQQPISFQGRGLAPQVPVWDRGQL